MVPFHGTFVHFFGGVHESHGNIRIKQTHKQKTTYFSQWIFDDFLNGLIHMFIRCHETCCKQDPIPDTCKRWPVFVSYTPGNQSFGQIRKPSEKDTGLPPPSIFGRCYVSFREGANIIVSSVIFCTPQSVLDERPPKKHQFYHVKLLTDLILMHRSKRTKKNL